MNLTEQAAYLKSQVIATLAHLSPGGMPGWGYIVFKTIYSGGCAALLAIGSVFCPFGQARENA